MHLKSQLNTKNGILLLALATGLNLGLPARAQLESDHSTHASHSVSASKNKKSTAALPDTNNPADTIAVEAIEETDSEATAGRKQTTWLGVFAEEAGEALSAQLNLDPGVGLVVTYVAPESPAANAGLVKNDLLVECAGQALVHPGQLRKLVHVRKAGDSVKLVFYRAGKKQEVVASLATAPANFGVEDGHGLKQGAWRELQEQLRDLPLKSALRERLNAMRESLKDVHIDQKQVQDEVRRSVDQVRRAMREALRSLRNADPSLDPVRKAIEELTQSGVTIDDDATVTVRNSRQRSRSIVKADDSGTLVIVCNPKPHLTAHDKEGNLVFDGEVDTPEQRAKVPREIWAKVEPLLRKVKTPSEPAPEAEEDR